MTTHKESLNNLPKTHYSLHEQYLKLAIAVVHRWELDGSPISQYVNPSDLEEGTWIDYWKDIVKLLSGDTTEVARRTFSHFHPNEWT